MRLLLWCVAIVYPLMGACDLQIDLQSDTPRTRATRDQLTRLLTKFDLTKWCFARKILIDPAAIPHSHPVLTLNTRAGEDLFLLSTFVHEQIHWFESDHEKAVGRAITRLEEQFPDLPTQPPAGARDRHSSYLHLIVGWLEYDALARLAGVKEAQRAFEHWAGHHYQGIYRLLLDSSARSRIGAVLAEEKLLIP